MKITGRVWKFGDNIDTDLIIPARYLNVSDTEELAKHCMEDLDPEFVNKVQAGDIIVAGKNYGCGSSREHAPLSLKASGISAVVAASFARIFYRNCYNIGLLVIECPEAAAEIQGQDELEIDLEESEIRNIANGKRYPIQKIPPFMQEIVKAGGLVPYVRGKRIS